jgi:hypothetical protein
VGLGVQSGWVDPTSPSYSLSGSDLLKIFTDIKRLAVRPAGRWLRYDTALVSDGNWYNCRVASADYDVDAEAGQIVGPIGSTAQTFTATTTGIWALGVRERFAGTVNGLHLLRAVTTTGTPLGQNHVVVTAPNLQTNWFYTEKYLTAGTQLNFQHQYNGFSVTTASMNLYTNDPCPEIIMRLVQERDLHS